MQILLKMIQNLQKYEQYCLHFKYVMFDSDIICFMINETQRGRPVYTRIDRSAFFGLGPKTSQFWLSRDGHMWNV